MQRLTHPHAGQTHTNVRSASCSICPVTLSVSLTPNFFPLWTFGLSLKHMLKALLSPTLSLISALQQATDEDSPPNNFLTYTIISASAFPSYFSINMVEGYAGTEQHAMSLGCCRSDISKLPLVVSVEAKILLLASSRQ